MSQYKTNIFWIWISIKKVIMEKVWLNFVTMLIRYILMKMPLNLKNHWTTQTLTRYTLISVGNYNLNIFIDSSEVNCDVMKCSTRKTLKNKPFLVQWDQYIRLYAAWEKLEVLDTWITGTYVIHKLSELSISRRTSVIRIF